MHIPIILLLLTTQLIFVIVIASLVLLTVKIARKESFPKSFVKLLPFYPTLLTFWLIGALIWDNFVEGKDKLFYYWDQLPLGGFLLWTHDQPATRGSSKDLAPGVSLLTISIIWLCMLVGVYGLTFYFKETGIELISRLLVILL